MFMPISLDASYYYYNCQSLLEQNEALQKQIYKSQAQLKELRRDNAHLENRIAEIESLMARKHSQEHRPANSENNQANYDQKSIIRRTRCRNNNKNYACPYEACPKIYASDLALNLHIKQKHNGGTKGQRLTYAVGF